MAKRRTKKEKLRAAHRHSDFSVLNTTNIEGKTQFSITTQQVKTSDIKTRINTNPTPSYTYVVHDARNTITITMALLVLDALIYFLLKQAIISIPGIGF